MNDKIVGVQEINIPDIIRPEILQDIPKIKDITKADIIISPTDEDIKVSKTSKNLSSARYLLTSDIDGSDRDLYLLRDALIKQAISYGFDDDLKFIHSCMTLDELLSSNIVNLEIYANIMGIMINRVKNKYIIASIILQEKIRFMELQRYYARIEYYLFCLNYTNNEYSYLMLDYLNNGLSMKSADKYTDFKYYDLDSKEQILYNGIDHYYFTTGDLSIEGLLDEYDRFTLLLFLGHLMIQSRKPYKLVTNMKNEDIAALIMWLIDYIKIDVRSILGAMSIYRIHNLEDEEPIITLNEGTYISSDRLILGLRFQGYVANKNMKNEELYLEYMLHTLYYPNFVSDIESNRTVERACKYPITPSGTIVERNDYIVFYGQMNGNKLYDAYTLNELADTFEKYKGFFDPRNLKDNPRMFSLASINKLMTIILPKKLTLSCRVQATRLINVIRKLFYEVSPLDITRVGIINDLKLKIFNSEIYGDMKEKDNILSGLLSVWNMGRMLYDWNIDDLGEKDLFDASLKDNITNLTCDNFSGRTKCNIWLNILDCINVVKKVTNLGILPIIKYFDGDLYISSANELECILGLLESVMTLNNFNILSYHRKIGSYLITTAMYYRYIFFKNLDNNPHLDFSNT